MNADERQKGFVRKGFFVSNPELNQRFTSIVSRMRQCAFNTAAIGLTHFINASNRPISAFTSNAYSRLLKVNRSLIRCYKFHYFTELAMCKSLWLIHAYVPILIANLQKT